MSSQHSVSIEDINWAGYLSIYPNPLRGKASVSFTVPKSGEAVFKIFNMNGDLLSIPYKAKVEVRKNYIFGIDVSALKKGIYIGLLKTNTGYSVFKKLIVE